MAQLLEQVDWESRLQTAADILMSTGRFLELEDLKQSAAAYVERMQRGLQYVQSPGFGVNADLVSIKAKDFTG